MALCLAESIVEAGWDLRDQLRRYVCWYREGYLSSTGQCFDIGQTVLRALGYFERTGETFAGPADVWSAGNGSIMRLAPVPLAFAGDPATAVARAAESSRTTHGAESAVDCCRYLAGLIAAAVVGVPKEELLSSRYEPTSRLCHDAPLDPAVDEVAAGSFKHREPPEIQGSGYVVRSLEAALWALHRSSMFRDGALLAVNLGEDADTTGAVYGQLAGAIYGANQIPAEWRERLAMRELLERRADELFALATQGPA